jgi:microcystin-dependent protein
VSATLAMNFMISPFGLFPLFEGVQVQTEAAPFLCEGRMFAFERAPAGWAYCDGQLMPIKGNAALYALLGPMYGGDGKKAFALPDLRDSIPMEYAPDSLRGAGNNPVKRDSAAIMKSADTLTNTSVGFLAINYCICVDGPLPSRDRSA